VALFAVCSALTPRAAAPVIPAAATWVHRTDSVVVGGLERTYVLVRPAERAPTKMPVLIVLHGRTMTPAGAEEMTSFLPVVGPAIVVYPAGYEHSWNAGACCGEAHAAGTDDVGFIEAVVHRTLETEPDASSKAVYLAGYSNGGRMAFRLACEAPQLFAGIAAVEAVSVYACPHPKPVSLLEVASRRDPLLALDANQPEKVVNGFHEPTVAGLVTQWRQADACQGAGRAVVLGTLTQSMWSSCKGGTRLAYALYGGGSHAWPHGDADTPSAERVVWSFFRNRPLTPPNG
jgi:polyhydroxybutyrate depolymerase